MVVIPPAPSDDVDDRADAPAVRRRERIGEHRHLIDRHQRDVREDGLATPYIDTVCAVDLKPCLPSACTVRGDENFVHEDGHWKEGDGSTLQFVRGLIIWNGAVQSGGRMAVTVMVGTPQALDGWEKVFSFFQRHLD